MCQPKKTVAALARVAFVSTLFFVLVMYVAFATRRLRLAGRLQPRYRALRILSWLAPVAFLAFMSSIGYGLAGLGQRVFLGLVFAWQLIAARGLEVGAFSVGVDRARYE